MTPDARAVALVARLSPWLAPLPTAWLVAVRTYEHLAWPWYIAAVAGLTIELLGLAATFTALESYTYNKMKRKNDPAAPLVLPFALVGVYFLSAELLTAGLDIAGQPVTFAKLSQAIFPALSLVGMATLAIRVDHEARVAETEAERERQRAERRAQRAERVHETVERGQVKPDMSTATTYSRLTCPEAVGKFPGLLAMPTAEAATLAGVCERTIRNWRNNGNGKEIEHVGPGSD
jgi:hypothetical protein